MSILLALIVVGGSLLVLLGRDVTPARLAEVDPKTPARLVASARLRRLEEEREERFRGYHRAWSLRGVSRAAEAGAARGYVVAFRAGGRR